VFTVLQIFKVNVKYRVPHCTVHLSENNMKTIQLLKQGRQVLPAPTSSGLEKSTAHKLHWTTDIVSHCENLKSFFFNIAQMNNQTATVTKAYILCTC
jgi:hypothetical protein